MVITAMIAQDYSFEYQCIIILIKIYNYWFVRDYGIPLLIKFIKIISKKSFVSITVKIPSYKISILHQSIHHIMLCRTALI